MSGWPRLVGSALALLVLAAGLGVAWVIFSTQYRVRIVNESQADVRALVVSGGGVTVPFEPLAPGQTGQRTFRITQDGVLRLRGESQGRQFDVPIEDYVTHGMGGRKAVYIKVGGAIEVREAPSVPRQGP